MTTRHTIKEAAADLRKSERWLRGWLQAHHRDHLGRPFFARAGRTKLFTPDDIDRIDQAMRPKNRVPVLFDPRDLPRNPSGSKLQD